MTRVARAGGVFVVLYIAAWALSLGELLGGFADPDRFFIERFEDGATRIRDMGASYLLALAGLSFAWFSRELADGSPSRGPTLRLTGYAAAAAMLLAAVAAATTPMSVWLGALFDDPGIQQGQGVLPQFAYVALAMGAMLPAGILIITAARPPSLLPRWLEYASYPVGGLVAIAAVTFLPLLIFPIWMIAVVIALWRPAAPT
ncbi:MAG: hypothetical protein V3V29_02205 [Acidimicrobiia bacterium]